MTRLRCTLILLLTLLASINFGYSKAISKKDLRVLYVGGSADWMITHYSSDQNYKEDVLKRTNSFKAMLSKYFTHVETVQSSDYLPELSDYYDVTIFDGIPPVIGNLKISRRLNDTVYQDSFKMYLPDNYSAATVFIADVGSTIGASIGLKTDWYCLCLDADAHHIRINHPIFKGPFIKHLTTVKKPTPKGAYHYKYYNNNIPDSLSMWRVQTIGYKSAIDFRIGMVSRPWGFTDSPDAEYISSGVCDKTLDAVAIGRHGNFLEWGFAASPDYMTEEAQKVFANAIVYISKFTKDRPIARKYNERVATRDYLQELKYLARMEVYKDFRISDEENIAFQRNNYNVAKKKQTAHQELNSTDTFWLDNYKERNPTSYSEYLKAFQGEAFDILGEDQDAYVKYYDINKDYFYCLPFDYNLKLDKVVAEWGIANNDIRLLEKAISLLETENKNSDNYKKALGVLHRYTLCDFKSASDWRRWFNANKNKLFFTQSGGWIFMTGDKTQDQWANYKEIKHQFQVVKDNGHVKTSVKIDTKDSLHKNIIIHFEIEPGYHIYNNVPNGEAYTPTSIEVILPQGYKVDGEMIKPFSSKYDDTQITIFQNSVDFIQPISGRGIGNIKCIIDFQACDSRMCTPPQHSEIVLLL